MQNDVYNRTMIALGKGVFRKTPNNPAFDRILPDSGGAAVRAVRELAEARLPAMRNWSLRLIDALPEADAGAAGYRELIFDDRGRPTWRYPRSNEAERIAVYLQLEKNPGRRTLPPGGRTRR